MTPVYLITGATSGIGAATALQLAQTGGTVVLVGRDATRTAATAERIRAATGNASIDTLLADLSVQSQVRALADAFKARYTRLDVLVNNAGAIYETRQETADGIELTLALNHLSYFLLTLLLVDVLRATPGARVVNVASDLQRMAKLSLDNLQSAGNSYSGMGAYALSKLGNIMFTYELARRLAGTGVTVNAMHPGGVRSNFGKNNSGFIYRLTDLALLVMGRTPERAAEDVVYLATSPDVAGETGKYFVNGQTKASAPPSYDAALTRGLWEASAQLTGLPADLPTA